MNVNDINAAEHREPTLDGVSPQFLDRWSPRAMSGEAVSKDQLSILFEAARWSPSCFNAQPWRFVYATCTSQRWSEFVDLLMDANQAWARNAGALVAIASRRRYEHNNNDAPTHSFDAGAAWMSIALQARTQGLVTHAMWGFHHDQANHTLNLSDLFRVEAMVAIGWPGEKDDLPENYRERELPTPRKPLTHLAFEDSGAGA